MGAHSLAVCCASSLPTAGRAQRCSAINREWFEAKGLTAHLSVTDETDYAASFCVVEKIQAK